MVKLYDISDWPEQSWWNTGGTRDKKIYQDPNNGELYYFKQSYKKGSRDYKHEFWSEIIASRIGEHLELNILAYHIAIRGKITGCISKAMINSDKEELIEGGKYLQAYDSNFNPENVKLRSQYNIELIINALKYASNTKFLKNLSDIIVFDALIGNSDRHQENWAIINVHSNISNSLTMTIENIDSDELTSLPLWAQQFIRRLFTKNNKIRPELIRARYALTQNSRFAPIYDSGCSFGRELDHERIIQMLESEKEIEKYINKGLSEIHWGNKKVNHFEFINRVLELNDFKNLVLNSLKNITERFNENVVTDIVLNIDKELKLLGSPHILPNERKELVMKLLTLRIKELRAIYAPFK